MSRKRLLHVVTFAAIFGPALLASAQTGIEPPREIHLPVPNSRGSYSHYPIPGLAARDHFSLRVTPDQSLLVFDSDTSGNWPFVRVKKWWTENPVSEVLKIPGWTAVWRQLLFPVGSFVCRCHALLAYCRRQHGDYDGVLQRQWLSVFRSDDLSDVGFINLGNSLGVLQAIGSGEGHTYVLTLEHGETLRVYAIPDRQ